MRCDPSEIVTDEGDENEKKQTANGNVWVKQTAQRARKKQENGWDMMDAAREPVMANRWYI